MKQLSAIEVEKALIGCCLVDNTIIGRVDVAPVHFFDKKHSKIFEGLRTCQKSHGTVDILILVQYLTDIGEIDNIGGFSYISAILDVASVTTGAEDYARIIRKSAQQRALVDDMRDLAKGINEGISEGEVYARAQKIARLAEPINQGTTFLPIQTGLEYFARHHERQIEILQKKRHSLTVATPWQGLNELLGGGFSGGGRPYVLAAAEKIGKTQVAIHCILHAAMNGAHCVYFSIEVSTAQVLSRMVGLLTGINPKRAYNWIDLSDHEQQEVIGAMQYLHTLPMHIDGNLDAEFTGFNAEPTKVVNRMVGHVERLEQDGTHISMVVIDNLGLMEHPNAKDERLRLASISNEIQAWAKRSTFPVIEVAHCKNRGDNLSDAPTHRELHGTSQISKDCAAVIICDRPPMRKSETEQNRMSQAEKEEAYIIVDIQQDGPTGKVPIRFDATCGAWHAVEPTYRPPSRLYVPQDLPPETYNLD